MRLYLFHSEVAASQHFRTARLGFGLPVGVFDLFLFIDLLKLVQLLLGGEAGISLTLTDELLGVGLINGGALALPIGAVSALVGDVAVFVKNGALVKVNAVGGKCANQSFSGTRYLALGVGVLDTQEKHAAALVSQSLAHRGGEQTAEVDKARGTGRKTGDLGALGKHTGRILRLDILGGGGNIGEKQLGKSIGIHGLDLSNSRCKN